MDYDPDDILNRAIRNLAGGVDIETAHDAVADTLLGLREAAKAFKDMNFREEPFHVKCGQCKAQFDILIPMRAETLAKAMSHAAKVIDETARLTQFVEGKADSRPDLLAVTGLSGLTDEQLRTVMGWLAENEQRTRASV
jgi:hypothetical protein